MIVKQAETCRSRAQKPVFSSTPHPQPLLFCKKSFDVILSYMNLTQILYGNAKKYGFWSRQDAATKC